MTHKAFMVCLMREAKRVSKALAQANAANLDLEIVEAIDGLKYRNGDKVDWDRLRHDHPFTNDNWGATFKASEVGCYHSHMEAYRRIVEQDLPSAFILEDDFCLVESPYGFHEVAREIESIPDWFHCCLHNDMPGLNVNFGIIGNPHPMFNRVSETPLITLAYAVSRKFAEYMLENHSKMDSPIDHLICRTSRNRDLVFLKTVIPIADVSDSPTTQQ